MPKGLDIGTMNIICSERKEEDVVFTQQINAFVELESSDLTKTMMDSAKVLYIEKDGRIYILGADAFKFSIIFGNEALRRPMKRGIISPKEKEGIAMIKLIVERVLGEPSYRNEVLCISSPADPIDLNVDTLYYRKMVGALAREMNYEPHLIDKGLAVIYSELLDYNLTGLAINIGAGLTNVTLAYLDTPDTLSATSFSIGRGGDWIDEHVSITTGLPKEHICAIKEKGFELGSEWVEFGSPECALSLYYDALMTYIIKNLKRKLSNITPPNVEFPVVLAGGSTQPSGFLRMFEKKLREANFQIDISHITLAREPLYSVARGCLIAARIQEGEEKGGWVVTQKKAQIEADQEDIDKALEIDTKFTDAKKGRKIAEENIKEQQPTKDPTLIPCLSIERTIYDPYNDKFILSRSQNLPQVRDWIKHHDPSAYWFVVSVRNNTREDIKGWGIELEMKPSLRVEQALIKGIEGDQKHEISTGRPWESKKYGAGVSSDSGIVISPGTARQIYFKLRSDRPKTDYTLNAVFKCANFEPVPINPKSFTFWCDGVLLPMGKKLKNKGFSNTTLGILFKAFGFVLHLTRKASEQNPKYEDIEDDLSNLKNTLEGLSGSKEVSEFLRRMDEEIGGYSYLDYDYKSKVTRLCKNLPEIWEIAFLKGTLVVK